MTTNALKQETENWVEVVALEDIPVLGSRVVKTDTMVIAVFRTASDEVFAMKDECPHKQGPLSQGIVHGTSVTCLHRFYKSIITKNIKQQYTAPSLKYHVIWTQA